MNEELKAIVQRMIDAGEPEENIKLVIQSYSKEPGKTTDPASSSMDSGSENGSLESQGLAKLNLEDYSTKSEDYEDVFVGFLKAIPVLATDSEQRAKAVQFMKNRVDNVPEALKSWIKSSAQVYADTYKRGYLSEDSILSKLIGDEKVKTASEGVDDYIIQKYKEIGELEFKDTGKGMVVGAKEGDAASVVAGVFGAGISMAETVIPAAATGGISLFPMIAAPMYTEYNKSKAKALYGEGKTQLTLEEEQSALEKLVENEQAEIAVPLALGSIATGLEYIGFKGITKYISASPMKGKFLANLLWTGSREGFTEVGQLGVETLNEGLGAQKPIKEASIEAWNTMNSDKGLEMWLNGFLGSTQISVGGRALNRALRSDNASVKELNSKINNLADLNSKKYNTKNNDVKEALEKEIKVAEKDIKDYINKKRKISEILNEDQKESLINIINEKDNITSKIESLKKQLEGGVISNKEFGYAARSLNNQDKRLTEQIEAINETAKQQLLVTGLEATKEEGETVGLKQKLFETKEQYASLFGKKGSKKYNEALKADGHISDDGSTYYVNMDTAREAGAIGVGSHELLHGIIGKSFSKLEPEAQRKLNENFLNLLSKRDKETVLNRLAGAYGITGDKVFTTEELYTAFSDEIVDGGVKFNEGMFGKIKNAYEEILRQLSSAGYFSEDNKTKFLYRKEFGNARQAYNFVKDYSLTIKKTGKVTQRAKDFAKVDPGSEGNLASKTITDAVDKLGKVDKDGNNLTEKGTGNFYYQAEADDVVKQIKEKGYLDNLIAARYKADKVPKNFVSDVITALTPDIKSFKPEENNSLFGYLQGRITFRAGDVYNKIYKQKEEDKGSRDVGETTKEGDVKIQVAAETTSEMKQLEEKDMSIQAQIQEKADKQKTKQQAESKFRKTLGLETGGVLYMKVLDAARKSLLRAYSTKDTVRQIQRNLRDQANTYLFKDVKNLLGTNKYEANLKQYREIIMESLFVADLVQMERETSQDDRVFTKFVKKLTTKQEVEDAVNQNLLPPSAINAYNKDKSVNLYKKGNPTEKQFLSYFMIPAINPVTGLRSGKKGTRKDTLAKNMAGALSYDATMEVAQEKEVAEKREQLSEVRGEDIGSLERLAEAINRDMDVKFSKTINSSKVPKISQYLKYQENKLGVNHPGFEFVYTIRQSVEEGLDLKTAYDNAKAALPSQSPILDLIINDGNLNNLHIDNIVYGVNNFVLGKIRKLGHDSSVKYLKNKLKKATTNKQKVAIVNEYLKNIGRSVRSSMVDGITTNEKLRDDVIVPLGLGDFYTLAKAQPRGKKLMFRESTETEQYESVELYENIEAIKNDPDGKRNKVNEQAEEARKYIKEILDSKLDAVEKKAIVQLMAYDQRGALRKSSKLGMNTVGLKSSETIMEHEFTVKDLVDKLNDYIDDKDVNLEELFNKGKVHVLPKQLDQILRDEKISQRGDNRYENQKFKQKLNEYISDGIVVNAKFSKSQDFTKANNATSFSRSTNNPTKGITVLDFDDTLATTKSLVKFTRPDGTTGTLNAEQYASTYENLLDQGYTFDFSEFNKVVKGKLAPLFQKALKLQSKFGPKNMFVLTARPPAAQKAIFDFLKANGLNIPIDNITGLGNSTAEAKALWIADKVGEGFNDFYFADDALQNVQAVDDVLSQLGVKRKVQQAKVKFSKSLGKDLAKNKNYTKFRNSLKGSVLYHGGTASLSDNKAVWFIASDFDGAELYADRRDGKVYSINSNSLNNAIIIPDVSDLIGFEKVIKNKYKSISKEVLNEYDQVDIKKVLETDVASEVISDFMDYVDNKFELLEGVYGPETLYDNDGKISKGIPVIVLGGNVSTKVSKVKFSKSIQTIPAVANMLDQFDVKSKVQQARVKFSKTMNNTFNDILQEVTGIEAQKRFSAIKGRKRGDDKGKFRFFIPPSHEDFVGLLYNFMGEGRRGDAHRDFLEQALVRPLNRAYRELDTAKQAIANDYKKLNEKFPDVNDKLVKTTPDGDFTFQDAIRVYLWNKHGHKIPGLTETDQAKLTKLVESDPQLQTYAETLNVISKQEDYVAPGQAWETANIRIDLVDATGRVGRAQYLSEFIENADVLFSEENLNKIEAAYGKDFREALEDMLHRIKTGVNRPKGQSGKPNKFLNWLNASVAGVMFFNTRSALLQQLSNVNYLNFADNNILAAGKAFANQKQYWKDFAFILNSDMLKQRRGGIGTDVNGAELVEAIKKARPDSLFDQVAIITGKLLRLGFLPTQMGDSIAIATGGAAFYRNRINTYLKQGLSQKEAEAKAFTDFQDITQSTQQSARPDMTSQQQASWIGKLVLNFLNTPSQYNRIIKKAGSDLKNRRITKPNTTQIQSDMSNLSRILYYGAAQNLIFYGLQTALFAVMFGTEEDDESEAFLKKKERVINGSIDTILRGSGIYGVALSTIKNMMIKFAEQREKGYNKDESAVIMEALNFSPVLGIRARKIVNAEKTLNYNTKVIDEMTTFDIDNPQWSAVTNYVEGTTTLPVNRLYQKTINVRNALDNQYTAFQRAMFFSGYTTWSLDLGDTEKMKKIKEKVKSKKKSKGRKTFKRKTLTR